MGRRNLLELHWGGMSVHGTLRKSGRFALRSAKGSILPFAAVVTNGRNGPRAAFNLLRSNGKFVRVAAF